MWVHEVALQDLPTEFKFGVFKVRREASSRLRVPAFRCLTFSDFFNARKREQVGSFQNFPLLV